MTKLIYVHEGKQTITKGRNELKNPVYFSGVYEKEKIEDLWKQVWTYITNTYDEDKYGTITNLPILLNKKTFTSMAIKSLLSQCII